MAHLFFSVSTLLIAYAPQKAWIPSKGLLYGVLVLGGLFFAGVVLSALSFYEDQYWADEQLREELRLNPSRREG